MGIFHVNYTLPLADLNETPNSPYRFPQTPNFTKILPMVAELFHTDRQAGGRKDEQRDLRKLIVNFRNFAKAPVQEYIIRWIISS
jgi:hypothetical protein